MDHSTPQKPARIFPPSIFSVPVQKKVNDGEKLEEEPTLLSRHSSWSSDSEQKNYNDEKETKKVQVARPEVGVKPEVGQNRLATLEVSSPLKKANEVPPLNRLKEELGMKLQQQFNNNATSKQPQTSITTSQQQRNNNTTSHQQLNDITLETNTPTKLKFKTQTSPEPKIFKEGKIIGAKGPFVEDDREIEQPMSLPMPNDASHPDRYTMSFFLF